MKAQDLRIGNYVRCYNVNITVSSIDISFIEHEADDKGHYNLLDTEGIPLTEEWLLKFGFEKENKEAHPKSPYFSMWECDYKYSFAYADFRKDWGFYHSYTDACLEEDNNKFDFISCGIKHVHQLQNLYFALTGEELKIKE